MMKKVTITFVLLYFWKYYKSSAIESESEIISIRHF